MTDELLLSAVLTLFRAKRDTGEIAYKLRRPEAEIERLLHVALGLEKERRAGRLAPAGRSISVHTANKGLGREADH